MEDTISAPGYLKQRVATLEDIGYGSAGEDEEPAYRNELEEDWEIPF